MHRTWSMTLGFLFMMFWASCGLGIVAAFTWALDLGTIWVSLILILPPILSALIMLVFRESMNWWYKGKFKALIQHYSQPESGVNIIMPMDELRLTRELPTLTLEIRRSVSGGSEPLQNKDTLQDSCLETESDSTDSFSPDNHEMHPIV